MRSVAVLLSVLLLAACGPNPNREPVEPGITISGSAEIGVTGGSRR